ncbi:MAG: hypothetical protein KKH94_02305 [Candidatus Omnitrophica bacterium]|nr:hypothetical protein [Candidatus Omnitrophota bacterium]
MKSLKHKYHIIGEGWDEIEEIRNVPKKIKILKFVVEQGIVSVDDVKRKFDIPDKSDVARKTMSELKISHVKYGSIKNGVWYVDRQELLNRLQSYYMKMPDFQPRKIRLHEVPHALQMNHIRLMLEKSKEANVVAWQSEAYIRALPPYQRNGFGVKKMPDAIFFRGSNDGGAAKKYFLEYERTLKNKERYTDIWGHYMKRIDVTRKSVLYICENALCKARLLQMMQSIQEREEKKGGEFRSEIFRFETIDEFNQAFQKKGREVSYADDAL